MSVPFLDVAATYRELREEIDQAVGRVLERGWFVLGEEVDAFEEEFARYCGARHCVGVSNGLDALRLALTAAGVGAGDEVIVPSHTFVATWLAVTQLGATVVPVEPDPRTFNLDPDRLESALTPRTKVALPVHLYGQPAALDAICAIAAEHGVTVIEDAAQAQGARYRGQAVGGSGNTAAWSFYPAKNLGAFGDAGAVTTDDDDVAARLRLLRNYGSGQKYVHDIAGGNTRLDELQAAVLRVKLRHLDDWNERRRSVAKAYQAGLAETGLALPVVPDWAAPSWHLYVVRSTARDALRRHLDEQGIGTVVHYPVPPHRQRAYADLGAPSLPVAEQLAAEVLSLPIGPHITAGEVDQVISAVLTGPGA